jgi:hypothetical protein
MTGDEYTAAIKQGHEVALAVAVKRFRDEYKWEQQQVSAVGRELIEKIDDRMSSEIDRIAEDLARLDGLGRPQSAMHCMIVASMALIGAQVCEGFEMARRAERN